MPCLQPKIMIVDGFHQDGPHAAAIGAQGIGEDLIAHQGRIGCRDAVLFKASQDASAAGFGSMGNAVQAVGGAELFYPGVLDRKSVV